MKSVSCVTLRSLIWDKLRKVTHGGKNMHQLFLPTWEGSGTRFYQMARHKRSNVLRTYLPRTATVALTHFTGNLQGFPLVSLFPSRAWALHHFTLQTAVAFSRFVYQTKMRSGNLRREYSFPSNN